MSQSILRNAFITCFVLSAALAISLIFFYTAHGNSTNIAVIFMLGIVIIARYTDGYIPGVFASFVGVICVNYVFTYPYMQFNFILDGYPVTFAGMMIISSIISTITTHMKKQSQILLERDKMLMEAEKETMRANLLRAISHDLRTPLASIIGSSGAYLESDGSLSEKQKRNLIENVYEDSNWLLHMVENLLSVTRIRDDSKNCLTKSMEPVEEVVSEAVQRFKKRTPKAQVTISVPDDFIMIPMDATLIEQVIINLLENAFYHSKSPNPILFQVKVRDRFAWFSVTDYGVGIPDSQLRCIFDGASIANRGGSDSKKGMGIGLSICKTIILAHEGEIFAKNHEGGAEFTFSLPLEYAEYLS